MKSYEKMIEQENKKREKILEKHFHGFWQGKSDGYFYINVKDSTRSTGLRRFKSKTLEGLKEKVIKFYTMPDYTVGEIFLKWNDHKYKELEDIQFGTYVRNENRYKKYFEGTDFAKILIGDLEFKHIRDFLVKTVGTGKITAKEYSNIRSLLIGMIKYARIEGFTELSSYEVLDVVIAKNKFKSVKQDCYQKKEVRKIEESIDMNSANIYELAFLLSKKIQTRPGELSTLKVGDFNFADHTLTLSRSEGEVENPDYKKGKGPRINKVVVDHLKCYKESRKITICDEVEEIVKRILEINPDGEYLFEINGKRIKGIRLTEHFAAVAGKLGAGDAYKTSDGHTRAKKRGVSHLRMYGSSFLLNGTKDTPPLDYKMVQKRLGHEDMRTTDKYYCLEIDSDNNYERCRKLLEEL